MQLDGGESEAEFPAEIPDSDSMLNHLLASWKSYHGYPASTKTSAMLHAFILGGMMLGQSSEAIAKKGAELVMKGQDTTDEQHDGSDFAQEGGTMEMIKRRGLTLARLALRPKISAGKENDPEPFSPVDDTTRRFLRDITGPSSEGKSLLEDFEEALTSPTYPVFPPEAFGAELEGCSPDTSAELQIDRSIPPATTDEYSESDLAPTWPSFSDDETETGDSSESFSALDVSANQKEEVSGEEQIKEPLQSVD